MPYLFNRSGEFDCWCALLAEIADQDLQTSAQQIARERGLDTDPTVRFIYR